MIQILIGSLLLSIVHALIPNHWIPLIAIGKAENWTHRETVTATIIAGLAHTTSTVIIGIIVGFAGFKLSENYETITTLVAPLTLITIGIIYFIIDLVKLHKHNHSFSNHSKTPKGNRSRWTLLTSISIAMFFSPCIELEAFFFQAGTMGWPGIIIVSVIYTITTVFFMAILVSYGTKGVKKLEWHFLEHHEKRVTGLVLILIGILAFFVKF